MTETMANGYSFNSDRRELSNEYHNDRVKMIFIFICFFVHWIKVTSAAEGLRQRRILPRYSSLVKTMKRKV